MEKLVNKTVQLLVKVVSLAIKLLVLTANLDIITMVNNANNAAINSQIANIAHKLNV